MLQISVTSVSNLMILNENTFNCKLFEPSACRRRWTIVIVFKLKGEDINCVC